MQWWQTLRGRPFYRVLDGSDPAASYYMLRHVVERPDSSRALKAARLTLQESEQVRRLKAELEREPLDWAADYRGGLWALRRLAEWEHPGDDEPIAAALDGALENLAQTAHPYAEPLLLHCARAFGFGADERVRALAQQVAAQLMQEGGREPSYVTLAAMAFAADPADLPDPVRATLEGALESLSPQQLPEFSVYTVPTFDTPDGLTIAEAALRLGLRGAWLAPWVEQVVAAQDEQGLWRAGRAHVRGTEAEQLNLWISARSLYVLRAYYGE